MNRNPQKFGYFEPAEPASPRGEPSAGLFDRIILAIKREQELRHSKRLLFGLLFLLVVSFVAMPVSWTMLVNQLESSGISYFISTAVSDFGAFLTLWQDFSLAILESLPITGIIAFSISIGMVLFTLRLFLYPVRNISLIKVLFSKG